MIQGNGERRTIKEGALRTSPTDVAVCARVEAEAVPAKESRWSWSIL